MSQEWSRTQRKRAGAWGQNNASWGDDESGVHGQVETSHYYHSYLHVLLITKFYLFCNILGAVATRISPMLAPLSEPFSVLTLPVHRWYIPGASSIFMPPLPSPAEGIYTLHPSKQHLPCGDLCGSEPGQAGLGKGWGAHSDRQRSHLEGYSIGQANIWPSPRNEISKVSEAQESGKTGIFCRSRSLRNRFQIFPLKI